MKRIMRREPLAALFAGGLLGAGVALMMAPKSAREVRRRIGTLAGDTNDKILCYARQGKKKVADLAGRGSDYVRGRKTLLSTAFGAGKDAYVKGREKLALK
jgi:gas vesicle protein